jgi:hypothetical protein
VTKGIKNFQVAAWRAGTDIAGNSSSFAQIEPASAFSLAICEFLLVAPVLRAIQLQKWSWIAIGFEFERR